MSSHDHLPAHILWVELSTRITTQRLHYRSGHEEAAATSIYSLFAKARELMEKHPSAALFQKVAERMINATIRPYTARWHGWTVPDPVIKDKDGQPRSTFRDPQVRRAFRQELRELQPLLLGYQKAFDLLRRGLGKDRHGVTIAAWIQPDPERQASLVEECSGNERTANLGQPLKAGLLPQVGLEDHYGGVSPGEIDRQERLFLNQRRHLAQKLPDGGEKPILNAVGLALSGGGIKSATFCLGVVQELVQRGIFSQVDYLSTVSGGGYLGAFISSFLGGQRDGKPETPESLQERVAETFLPQKNGAEARAVRHLRNHSQYLLEGGLFGKLNIAGLIASGVLANLLMILPGPIFVALALYFLDRWGYWGQPGQWPPGIPSPAIYLLITSAVSWGVAWFSLALVQRWTARSNLGAPPARLRAKWEIGTLILAIITVLLGLLTAYPGIVQGYHLLGQYFHRLPGANVAGQGTAAALAGLVPIVLAASGYIFKTRWLQKLLRNAFILSGPLFYLFVIILISTRVGFGQPGGEGTWSVFWITVLAAVWLVWSAFGININTFGPHRYYRARLCESYLVCPTVRDLSPWGFLRAKFWEGYMPQSSTEKSAPSVSQKTSTLIGAVLSLPLSGLGESKAAPYHLINTIVNLPASKNRNLRGRKGDFFVLSRDFCGSPTTGYVATSRLEAADPHLDLGSAMAISAAAANSNMGWRTLSNFQFLMTLLNIRLGYWIPNFRSKDQMLGPSAGPIANPNVGSGYLFSEMSGRIQENMKHLNLSDGGHIENLGAYELLRRKCKFILSVDGGANRELVGGDLQRLERYASIDFGITFEYDQTELQPDAEGISKASAILVKIHYSKDETGWLIYLRPNIEGIEPNYLLDHWRQNPVFPYESIIDQVFEEEQFEGYRSLGVCAVQTLFRPELGTWSDHLSVEKWVQALAAHLLPDNDKALLKNSKS